MKYERIRNMVTQLAYGRISQDSEESILEGKPLDEQLDRDNRRADFEALTSQAVTRKSLARWKMVAAVSITLCVLVTFSWIARELLASRVVLVPSILSTSGKRIDFPTSRSPNVFSPASVASEWEAVVFHNNFHEDRTPYQGPPTDEVDKAWESLYKNIGVIKIPKVDAERLPNQTLPIPGEKDGYIVGIEVYHQIHCLDTIRQSIYPERYGGDSGMSDDQRAFYWIHLEHCIDNIRQVIMCYSDISTIPWKYHERVDSEFPDAHTTHVCRNFNKLTEWMVHPERNFPQEKYQTRLDAYRAGELEQNNQT